MFIAPAIGNLHHAQPVARGDKPHRFRVDGQRLIGGTIGQHARRQVFFVKMNGHMPRYVGGMRASGKGARHASCDAASRLGERQAVTEGSMLNTIPESWHAALGPALEGPHIRRLKQWLRRGGCGQNQCIHRATSGFARLRLTPPEAVKAVILGQDPYHGAGQAHGLAFSVPTGQKLPPSLAQYLRELADDIGVVRADGDLEGWAQQGVLLLNTALSVEHGKAGSHRKGG